MIHSMISGPIKGPALFFLAQVEAHAFLLLMGKPMLVASMNFIDTVQQPTHGHR